MRCPTLNELPAPPAGKTGWPWTEESSQLPNTMPNGSPWPRVSIVTPSYNQGQFIEETIRSVLLQGYPNLEYIIIDGGSTDGTIKILGTYPHLRWISEKDTGQGVALNKGLRMARGEIIGWINSDDWYEAGIFKHIARFFMANPDKNVVMGDCNLVNQNGIVFDTVINKERGFKELRRYWIGRSIPTQPAIFFRKRLLAQFGCFDESLHYAMDYDLWMRFAQRNRFYHLNVTVANYRFHRSAKGGDQVWTKFVPEWCAVHKKYVHSGSSSGLVSVIIPCYNYGRYLRQAVESVLAQTYQNWEIIIVNDGSSDNTVEVAESLIKQNPGNRIRLINQANSGQPAISRNRGISEAKGEYILPLDADDMITPTMLEECLRILEADFSVAIIYTDRLDFDGVNQVVRARDYDFPLLRYANHISHCALYRREVWEAVGGYRTNVIGVEDWDFWVAAGAKGYFGRRIPRPLFKYRRHNTGLFQEVLRDFKKKAAQIVVNNWQVYRKKDIVRAFLKFPSLLLTREPGLSTLKAISQKKLWPVLRRTLIRSHL